MKLSPIFKLRTAPTEGIIELLENTVLGTNGAKYKHLDTRKRIHEADKPLFLSIERKEKVVGNITFCRREENWYIRYFAFAATLQAGTANRKVNLRKNFLRDELQQFFDEIFEDENLAPKLQRMYAYIDPRNERSLEMSHSFGFHQVANLRTQSFSRYNPHLSSRCNFNLTWEDLQECVERNFGQHAYYNDVHCKRGPFVALQSEEKELLAYARFTKVSWQINRLPGKFGDLVVKVIPYIPVLKKYIRPAEQNFLVPEIVWVRDNNIELLEELFSSALAKEKQNVVLWWIDEKEPLYKAVNSKMRWGLFHRLIGAAPVNVMQRRNDGRSEQLTSPVFVIANDIV